jgi:hypothetical protein
VNSIPSFIFIANSEKENVPAACNDPNLFLSRTASVSLDDSFDSGAFWRNKGNKMGPLSLSLLGSSIKFAGIYMPPPPEDLGSAG